LPALLPAATLAQQVFSGQCARALFAGMAAHAIMPLEQVATAAFGLMLGILAHAVGWPLARVVPYSIPLREFYICSSSALSSDQR